MIPKIARFLILCTVALVTVQSGFAKSGMAHINDITEILFDAEKSPQTKGLAAFISQGMDMGSGAKPADLAQQGSSFLNSLRKEFGSLKGVGEHREFAHWGLNGSIPEDFIAAMEKAHPGSSQRVVELWRQFVVTRREAVKQALNLSGPNSDRAAQALASMMNDIHVLGDHTTVSTANLRSIENVVNDYLKSLNRMLGNHNGLTPQIKAEIKALSNTLSGSERAAKILEILKSHNVEFSQKATYVLSRMGYTGDVGMIDHNALTRITGATAHSSDAVAHWSVQMMGDLKARLGKSAPMKLYGTLKASVNGRIERVSQQMAQDAYRTFENVYSPQTIAAMKDVKGVRPVVGVLQEVTMKDGSTRMVLSIPVENFAKGIKSGIGAGIMTFVFSEGATLYQFSRGEITQETFCWESAKNCSAGILAGTATFVAVVLGAAPGGWVVMGIGVGSYMLCDISIP